MPRCLAALSNPLRSLLSFHRRCKDTIVLTVLQPHQVSIMRHSVAFISRSRRITLLLCYSLSLLPVTVNHKRFFFSIFLARSMPHIRAHVWRLGLQSIYGHQSTGNLMIMRLQKIEMIFPWPKFAVYLNDSLKEVLFFPLAISVQSAADKQSLTLGKRKMYVIFHCVGGCVSQQHFMKLL